MKIGHNMVFLLLFLHRFKIYNISFTMTCITGKYFIKPWPDWGCFQLIWGQLGSSGLPWLLVTLLKILFHLSLLFWIWNALGWCLHRQGGLPLIYLHSSTGKETGEGDLHLLSAGMKTFPKRKLRNYKSDVNETYMIYVPP